MTKKPRTFQPRQVAEAFGGDNERPASPARLLAFQLEFNYRDDEEPTRGWLRVGYLGESGAEVELLTDDPRRLGEVLQRDDLTYLDGAVLLLVNEHYGVMGVATGPPTAPARIHSPAATGVEDGRVVEALGGADGIAWQIFAITRDESNDTPAQLESLVDAPDAPYAYVVVARIGEQRHGFGPMPRVGAVLLAQMLPRSWKRHFAADHPELDCDVESIPLYDDNVSAMDILATFGFREAPKGT